MLTLSVRDENTGQIVGVLVLSPKTFSSGKAGYFGQAKIEIGGQRYQAQAQAVAIAAKGDGDKAEAGD